MVTKGASSIALSAAWMRFEKFAHFCDALLVGDWCGGAFVEFAEIAAGGEAGFAGAGDDAGGGVGRERGDRGDKFFEFGEHGGADFVGGLAIEREFDDAVAPFPAKSFAGEGFHVDLEAYNASICDAKRSLMAVRRSLPMAVRRPESGVSVSVRMVKLRIWR